MSAPEEDDGLRAARGILLALILGLAVYAAVGLVFAVFF